MLSGSLRLSFFSPPYKLYCTICTVYYLLLTSMQGYVYFTLKAGTLLPELCPGIVSGLCVCAKLTRHETNGLSEHMIFRLRISQNSHEIPVPLKTMLSNTYNVTYVCISLLQENPAVPEHTAAVVVVE
jgi:hypothetical protein